MSPKSPKLPSHRTRRRNLTYKTALVDSMWLHIQSRSLNLISNSVRKVRNFFTLSQLIFVSSPVSHHGVGTDFVWSAYDRECHDDKSKFQQWASLKLDDLRRREVDLESFLRRERIRKELESYFPRDLALEILDFEPTSMSSSSSSSELVSISVAPPPSPPAAVPGPRVSENVDVCESKPELTSAASCNGNQMRFWTTDVLIYDSVHKCIRREC